MIYLFERETVGRRERGEKKILYCFFIFQMATTAISGSDLSQELGIPSGFPTWMGGGPGTWVIICCLPRLASRVLDQR